MLNSKWTILQNQVSVITKTMKKEELIKRLSALPANAEVVLADASHEDSTPIEITSVEEIECEKEPGSTGVIFFNN